MGRLSVRGVTRLEGSLVSVDFNLHEGKASDRSLLLFRISF